MKKILTWNEEQWSRFMLCCVLIGLLIFVGTLIACQPVQAEKEEPKLKTPTWKVTWYHENSGNNYWTATNLQYFYENGVRFTTDRGKTVWVYGQVSVEEE